MKRKLIFTEWDSRGPQTNRPTDKSIIDGSNRINKALEKNMTKTQKEAQKAAAALGEQYAKTARRVIKKARALGGDTATNLKAFMGAFINAAISPEPTVKPTPKTKKATK